MRSLERHASGAPGRARVLLVVLLGVVCVGMGPVAAVASQEGASAAQVHIPESIPVRREKRSSVEGPSPFRALVLFAMLGVVGVIVIRKYRPQLGGSSASRGWGTRILGRWLTPGSREGGVRLVQSVRLTPKSTVHVLEWDGREILVGCNDQEMTLLGERKASGEPGVISSADPAEEKP